MWNQGHIMGQIYTELEGLLYDPQEGLSPAEYDLMIALRRFQLRQHPGICAGLWVRDTNLWK
jgi:hypothetical protein